MLTSALLVACLAQPFAYNPYKPAIMCRSDGAALSSSPAYAIDCDSASMTCVQDGGVLTLASVGGGGGGGAPTNATYLTQTANATLTNEQALSALGTGLMSNTTGTGVVSIYAGTSCTNQFPRSLSAAGAATCASVALATDVTGTLAQARGGTGAGALTCSAGQALTSNGTAYSCTSSIQASDLFCVGCVDLSTEVTDTLVTGNGGTGLTSAADDNTMVGNGAIWQSKALPACADTAGNHLNYDTATNTFSCGTTDAVASLSFVTSKAEAALSGEQSIGALTTGLLLNTVAASQGTLSAYAGTSCTNQFPRSLNASGAATCASVSLSADVTGTLAGANGGLGGAQPTCGAGQYLTCNGTTCSCSTPAGGGGGTSPLLLSFGGF